MSTDLENLKRLSQYPLSDHQFILDMYLVNGRDINYMAIKTGMDPLDIIHLLEGYGEKILDGDKISDVGRGRLSKLPRRFIDEYVAHFYPGIAKNPVNDWITLEGYLNNTTPEWRFK